MSKGNKHGGRKTRIKNYRKTKHARISKANRKDRNRKAWGEEKCQWITFISDGDGIAKDIDQEKIIYVDADTPWKLARLRGGMVSGRSSLALLIELPDGRTLLAETSVGAWCMATAALKGAELHDGLPWEAP